MIGATSWSSKTPNTDLMPWGIPVRHTVLFSSQCAIMTKPTTEKIGGEFGDVRASIDLEKLNAYLEAHVPEVTAPVTVKQFKVCV